MVANLYLQKLLDPFILFIVDIALDQFNIAAIEQKVNSRVVNGLLSKSQGWSVDYVPVSVKLAMHLFKNQKDVLCQLREVLPFVFRFLVIRVNECLDVEPCLLCFALEECGCCQLLNPMELFFLIMFQQVLAGIQVQPGVHEVLCLFPHVLFLGLFFEVSTSLLEVLISLDSFHLVLQKGL